MRELVSIYNAPNHFEDCWHRMLRLLNILLAIICLAASAGAQARRVWVLKTPDAIVEFDPANFTPKQTTKVPEDVLKAARILQISRQGQMLFAPNTDDPSPDVGKNGDRFWFWDSHTAAMLGREIIRVSSHAGSNEKTTESSPWPFLASDGTHLYWFANQYNRMSRDNVDLTVTTSFRAWRSDLTGKHEEELASFDFPECHCPTGACSESCPEVRFWVPEQGANDFFVLTRLIPGQTETQYLSSTLYTLAGEAWTPTELKQPLQRVLDMTEHGSVILSAVLDTGCCGWENQSDDQTLLFSYGKMLVVFDEREQYKNPDYDVSFFTENAKLSPDVAWVAMTVEASAKANSTIQLAEEGQANPAESQRIRKSLADLPVVQVVSAVDPGKRLGFLPHATLVGWLSEKEILIVENHFLAAYDVTSGARRKSAIRVDDPSFVFLR